METIRYYENLETFMDISINTKSEYFLLIGEDCNFDFNILKNSGIKFKGAIFPEVVYEDFNTSSGIVACELKNSTQSFLIEDIKNINIDNKILEKLDSIMVIVDGLSKYITTFLESIFQTTPIDSQIVGCGAGKMTLKQEPVIFSQDGIFQDAAIIIAVKEKINVGLENGWEYLEGPFIVTSAEKNILKSLNFRNAFDVYKEIVERVSGLKFEDDKFYNIAKSYPLGIVKFNEDIVVRDTIGLDEYGNMILIGDIEQNSTINILFGEKEKLIESSSKTINDALKKVKYKDNIKNIVLFDCISRKEFLGSDFKKELATVKEEVPLNRVYGALTLGEIANSGDEYINFYNRTCVIGVLC